MNLKFFASSGVIFLTLSTSSLAFADDPLPIPRPSEVVLQGYTTEGYPIYGPVPGSDGAPIASPTNPAPIERPPGVGQIGTTPEGYPIYGPIDSNSLPPIRVNEDGSRIEADGSYTPPPLFNPDGTAYGGTPVLRIPGSTDAAPFGFRQDGTPVPPPLFNPDGTPFILGISPIPIPKPIIGAPFGYDSMGTPVPAPLWNPDGTPYVHGVSDLPEIPSNMRQPILLRDPIAKQIVNQEIIAADFIAIKKKGGYVLETDDQISYVDKSLTIIAIKRGAKPKTLTLAIDASGDLFVPTRVNLKGFQVQIKRSNKVIKTIKLN